ncbi:hypothetical protein [Staphylococcus simulans]|uniref:hypothetical protein n=1 Tax=Staphylococcus simulans TaxID=1286 RepID=UPI000CD15EFE|nr:hypothetical protein [Staphylococcus simulans]PNZ42869.1 hypothetical protein CD112_08990 [Staphylococcus simulans]SQE72963.1 Uncharacterised protein [Staphylococcus simulans]
MDNNKFEETILKHDVLDRDEFLDKYNPWQTERGKKVIQNFADIINGKTSSDETNEENFSWLAIEEVFEKEFLSDKTREFRIPANIDFGLPNHVKGDIDNSNLFICLTNPNIQVEDKHVVRAYYKKRKFKDFIESLTHYFDVFTSDADISSKKENFPSEAEVSKHIIDFDENILMSEFRSLLDDSLKGRSTDILRGVDVLSEHYYYLGKYFYPLFGEYNKETTFRKLQSKLSESLTNEDADELEEKIKKASICNVESFPFRSGNPQLGDDEEANFGRELLSYKNNTTLFSARIILRRIALSLKENSKETPAFIFRRFDRAWKNQLIEVLKKDYKVNNDEINEYINWLEKRYFYTFGNRDVNNMSSALINESIQKQDKPIGKKFEELKYKANAIIFTKN